MKKKMQIYFGLIILFTLVNSTIMASAYTSSKYTSWNIGSSDKNTDLNGLTRVVWDSIGQIKFLTSYTFDINFADVETGWWGFTGRGKLIVVHVKIYVSSSLRCQLDQTYFSGNDLWDREDLDPETWSLSGCGTATTFEIVTTIDLTVRYYSNGYDSVYTNKDYAIQYVG